MNAAVLLPLASICLLGAMSPGPSLAMVVRHTLSGGRVSGLAAAWSHALGIGIYALLTVTGLAVLLAKAPHLLEWISVVGGAYLFWLGAQAISAKHSIAATLEAGRQSSWKLALRDGLAISLLSPKIMLFFLALFSPLVALNSDGEQGLLVATPLLIDGLWFSLIALTLSQPLILNWMRRQARWIDRLSGLLLMGLAVWVIIRAFG